MSELNLEAIVEPERVLTDLGPCDLVVFRVPLALSSSQMEEAKARVAWQLGACKATVVIAAEGLGVEHFPESDMNELGWFRGERK